MFIFCPKWNLYVCTIWCLFCFYINHQWCYFNYYVVYNFCWNFVPDYILNCLTMFFIFDLVHSRVNQIADARFLPKVGRISPKWDNSRHFFRSDSLHFCSMIQNVMNFIWKNPRICPYPIWGQSDTLWAKSCHPEPNSARIKVSVGFFPLLKSNISTPAMRIITIWLIILYIIFYFM